MADEPDPTEHMTLYPTRDFETGAIDGVRLCLPITTPGAILYDLLELLGLEADDEWDEGNVLVVTALPRGRAA